MAVLCGTDRDEGLVGEAGSERTHIDQRLQTHEAAEVVGIVGKHLGLQVPV